jgi:AcrR family transcriptional regulator
MTVRIPAAERREQILLIARPLFARSGYAATRLDDVAAAAGVTKPILYRHYGSKKGLYMALLQRHEDDLPRFLADVPPQAILSGWLDYVRANSDNWLMLFRDSSGDEDIRALRAQVSRTARRLLAEFIAARAGSRIPPEQVDPTAELLTSGLAGLVLWWIDHPDVPKDVVLAAAARPVSAVVQ